MGAVREDPDSPAFYLLAMWWASVREMHEAFREERAALEEKPQNLEVAHAASARNHQARAAEKTRGAAFVAEVLGTNWGAGRQSASDACTIRDWCYLVLGENPEMIHETPFV